MGWKSVWDEWKSVAAALGVCLGAFLLHARAWYVGYDARALALLGCHFLRSLLLLLAWGTVVTVFKAAARKEKPATATRVTVLDLAGGLLILTGCVGCYPAWPVVLLLLTLALLSALVFSRKGAVRPAEDRPARPAVLPVGMAVLLFTLTWYLCASTTRQALRGLGARIDAKGGADRLRAWAAEVIAAHKQGDHPPRLARDEIPDWVDDLMGPFQGIRSVAVEGHGDDRCVTLLTGGSAYHFRISVCPAHAGRGPPPWWVGAVAGLEGRPGIYLSTEGK